MRILMGGYGVQRADWHVDEPVAAGYSRVYLIESGTFRYEEMGGARTLGPGRLYAFPASTPYSMRLEDGEPFCCIWLHIDFFPTGFTQVAEASPQEDTLLAGFWPLLRALYAQQLEKTSYGEGVLRAFGGYVQQRLLHGEISPMAEAAAYIRAGFRDSELNVNSISAHFGCTPEHFIRSFARAMGLTPYQYLLNMRMVEARRLLLENCSVQETARAVGYANPRVFSHAFQKKYGVAPGAFRRSFSPQA